VAPSSYLDPGGKAPVSSAGRSSTLPASRPASESAFRYCFAVFLPKRELPRFADRFDRLNQLGALVSNSMGIGGTPRRVTPFGVSTKAG
jgi:hypothetical protein